MPLKVAKIRPQGLSKDGLPDGSRWTTVRNCIDRDGAPTTPTPDVDMLDNTPFVALTDPIYGIYGREPGVGAVSAQNDTWFLVGDIANIVVVWATRDTDSGEYITPASYSTLRNPNSYTSGFLNGQLFLNDGANPPVTWNWDYATPSVMTDLAGWFGASDSCQSLRAYRDFLIAMDTNISGTRVNDEFRWSDRAPPGALPSAWGALSTNEAGSATLGDSPGRIVDGLQLGDSFMMYKPEAAYRMTEIGLPEVMAVRRASVTEGVMARNCVQTINNTHYVVGNQDIYQTDGVRSQSVINSALRRWFYNSALRDDEREFVYTAFNPEHNEFWVCFKSNEVVTDHPDLALIFDGNRWSVREIGNANTSNTGGTEGFPHIFTGFSSQSGAGNFAVDERLLAVDPDATAGTGFIAQVERDIGSGGEFTLEVEGVELAPPGQRATIKRVWPICNTPKLNQNNTALDITLGASEQPGIDQTTWGSAVTWDPVANAGQAITYPLRTRFLSIRAERNSGLTLANQQIWGYDVEYEIGGSH